MSDEQHKKHLMEWNKEALVEHVVIQEKHYAALEAENGALREKMNTKYWDRVRDDNVKLKARAEKAEAAVINREAIIRTLMDACDHLMGDTDLSDDESFEIRAMQTAAAVLRGEGLIAKEQDGIEHEYEVERLRVQLAGCLVAAEGLATGENDCKEGDYGWSESFRAVKELFERAERAEAELRAEQNKVIDIVHDYSIKLEHAEARAEKAEAEVERFRGLDLDVIATSVEVEIEQLKGSIKGKDHLEADQLQAEVDKIRAIIGADK
jgi:hypothetical protein